MYIGIISGAFKPFSKGHYALVKKASDENDRVLLFVSTGDRIRKGQVPITWKQMHPIWEKYIKKVLPKNVEVSFVPNPMTALVDTLIDANDNPNNANTYQLYADEQDIKRYKTPKLRDHTLARLFDDEQIEFRPLKRSFTAGVSGTKVRDALAKNNLPAFVSMMPEPLQPKGDIIYKKLGGRIRKKKKK